MIAGAADNLQQCLAVSDTHRGQVQLILEEIARVNWILENLIEMSQLETCTNDRSRVGCAAMDFVAAAGRQVDHSPRSGLPFSDFKGYEAGRSSERSGQPQAEASV